MPASRSTALCTAIYLSLLPTAVARGNDADELARYDATIKPEARRHWAFQTVKPVRVPSTRDFSRVRNPIDAFVVARLEERGWSPAPAASPLVLLRRLYLDLTGLPPTPAEQDAFNKDPSPEALDRVADELLARPEYGERWARHWLDVARYADSNGYERDAAKPSAWRYRDYVIDAFNKDKPFDRFIVEQLAGDELPDASAESVIATTFLRLGPWDDEPADPAADRFDQLDDIVSATSQAFLGLTLGCARCHNHKFEPLTMHDYYRMVAVFNPLTRPRDGRTERDLPAISAAGREAYAMRSRRLRAIGAEQATQTVVADGPLTRLVVSVLAGDTAQALNAELKAVPRAYAFEEMRSPLAATHLLVRGQASRPGPEVAPGVPAVVAGSQPAFPAPGPLASLRRLTLARWIARADNPLTARVIVNRVWQGHFGYGLVRTPGDFGTAGEKPTHPELLDWLAGRFVADGWSLKKLHRLIVTSDTYRTSKRDRREYSAEDPEERLLWRVPYRRLEAEAVRDSMLAVCGRLNPRRGGPGVFPDMPKEALEGHSDPASVWKPSRESEADRRTVYVFVKRSLLVPLVEVLDLCDTTRSTARRSVTTVAPQALTLYNGAFANRMARELAGRLKREVGDDNGKQIELAYRLLLCRAPSAAERAELEAFLSKQESQGLSAITAREQMCRVLLNLNEFVYPD
jgi:hypothetical protein